MRYTENKLFAFLKNKFFFKLQDLASKIKLQKLKKMIASEDEKPPWANAADTVVEIEVNGKKHKVPPNVKERCNHSPLSMIVPKSGKPQAIFRCYDIAAT